MTLRVGLIGTGPWARMIHAAGCVAHEGVELVGVWGRDPEKAKALAADVGATPFDNADALIDAVDAVSFAVPPNVQAPLALSAARAGRHLLLEKPIALGAADADELAAAVTERNLASVVFLTRRFVPAVAAWLDDLVARGGWECGRVELMSSFLRDNPVGRASAWRHEWGALWDIGPHALSLLLPVLGEVTAVTAARGTRDLVHLVLHHVEGGSSTASLWSTAHSGAGGESMYFDGAAGRSSAPAIGEFFPHTAREAYTGALDALVAQVAAPDRMHPCDVRAGATIVRVLATAVTSAESGTRQPVQVSGPTAPATSSRSVP
jgi:predicted dehydrogenase